MYFNCGWPARRARVSQVNQPVGEISCASRNRVSRDSSWTLPRASLLSYPAAAPVPFSLDTRHLIKKQNDSRASPRSTLLAFQTIIPETATGVRVSESLLPRLSGGALLLWRKETRRGFWELHEFIIAVRVSGSGDVFGVKSFITKGNNRVLSVFLDLDFDLFHDSFLSSSSRDVIWFSSRRGIIYPKNDKSW